MFEVETTVVLDVQHNEKKARQMGQLGLRQIVFSDQDLMLKWAFAVEALEESQLSRGCKPLPCLLCQTQE